MTRNTNRIYEDIADDQYTADDGDLLRLLADMRRARRQDERDADDRVRLAGKAAREWQEMEVAA